MTVTTVEGRKALLADLKTQVKTLHADLRQQLDQILGKRDDLHAEYTRARQLGRTGVTESVWLDERIDQSAVAWVLGTVFVRFLEDNGFLRHPYLTGPTSRERVLAEEVHEEFFRRNPAQNDAGWLHTAFEEIARSDAGRLLFDERHNPLYQLPISHDGAKALIAFWRRRDENGDLVHAFGQRGTNGTWKPLDTRFLGDLYQDMSESARDKYALWQTPEFIESFILDYTLTPAIAEFGHDVVRIIDPACGSGHFVLGAFHRLLKRWRHAAPTLDVWDVVRLSLSAVYGVDKNPFAAAITRFRLFLAALDAANMRTLVEVERHTWPINIAVGDTLIKSRKWQIDGLEAGDDVSAFAYFTEDAHEFPHILESGSFHAVVGNPPYITVDDPIESEIYRSDYDACTGAYALVVPFVQRFFDLARGVSGDGRGSGYVGIIAANSFAKREFGRALVEKYFPSRVELSHVVDTSGAYIPGHDTPTVILFGRNKGDRLSSTSVRVVMGIRGEPGASERPEEGQVWTSITRLIEHPGAESAWIGVADVDRDQLSVHPWQLAGGGARQLAQAIGGRSIGMLGDVVRVIGRTTHTGLDPAFYLPSRAAGRLGLDGSVRSVVLGKDVRDFSITSETATIFPYDEAGRKRMLRPSELAVLWRSRRPLQLRLDFGQTPEQRGLRWYDHSMFFAERFLIPASIALPFVATHNHFVLDRDGKVFNRSAPVIKLPEGATEDQHLELLGVLNSSTACFWLRQVSYPKGGDPIGGDGARVSAEPWSDRYEFTGARLQEFPLPEVLPLARGRQLDSLAQELSAVSPSGVVERAVPTRETLGQARERWHSIRGQMIAAQEELDWEVYSLYGLLDDNLTAPAESVPELKLGERAFEIVLARKMKRGEVETEWFARHGSTPITDLPGQWSPAYRAVVERRIALIEGNRNIGLIERPECKRRWASVGFDSMRQEALETWLLERFEVRELWFEQRGSEEVPRLQTTVQLADRLRHDADVLAVAELYAPGEDLEAVVSGLVANEHVPYLAALRYKDSGMSKRADWEAMWEKQRREDAAETEDEKRETRDAIALPPKFGAADFRKPSYWRNRGKLDVPKERFISYPHASRDGATTTKDGALLLGWAGFDHLQQARVLANLIVEREQRDGWNAERLTPPLAGLRETLPWVRQWHTEYDASLEGVPGEVFGGFLESRASRLRLTEEDLGRWRPPAGRGRRARS